MSQDTPDQATGRGPDPERPETEVSDAAPTTPAGAGTPAAAADAPAAPVAPTPGTSTTAAPVPSAAPAQSAASDPAPVPGPAPTYGAPSDAAPQPDSYPAADDTGPVASSVLATEGGPGLGARLGAEAFGTFLLVLAGVGTALYATVTQAGVLAVALAFGVALLAGVVAVGNVSGGHFNPAVTFGAVLAGRTPWRDLLPYWIAQVIGGAAATAVLFVTMTTLPALSGNERSFFSGAANGFGDHSPLVQQASSGFSWVGAGLVELVVTALFVGVILAATSRKGNPSHAPFAIGLTLTALILVALPVTNASLNPARSLAAAIFSESWALSQLWLFWAAPLVGAAIAALIYRAFAGEGPEDDLAVYDEQGVTEEEIVLVEGR